MSNQNAMIIQNLIKYFDRTVRKNKTFSSRVDPQYIAGNMTLQLYVHLKCSTLHTGEFGTEIVTWPH